MALVAAQNVSHRVSSHEHPHGKRDILPSRGFSPLGNVGPPGALCSALSVHWGIKPPLPAENVRHDGGLTIWRDIGQIIHRRLGVSRGAFSLACRGSLLAHPC